MAYGGLALKLLQFLDHLEDGSSPNPSGMGGENWSLYSLLVGSSQLLLSGRQVLLPDWGLHFWVGTAWWGSTEGYPALGRGGQLTPLIQVGGAWPSTKALE